MYCATALYSNLFDMTFGIAVLSDTIKPQLFHQGGCLYFGNEPQFANKYNTQTGLINVKNHFIMT